MKKITIAELAEKAEVSTTTIRRYLKNENVREEVAAKIKKAIKETGFDADSAKSKETKKTESVKKDKVATLKVNKRKGYTFGILTEDITNPRTRKTVKAIQAACYENECLFAIFASEGKEALEERYISFMIKQRVRAIIIENSTHCATIEKLLHRSNIPYVFLRGDVKAPHSLAVDEEDAGRLMGDYLIQKHHMALHYLGADETLAHAHHEGLRKAYYKLKQPLDFKMTISDGHHLDVYQKIKEIFAEKIDVLILERDEMAIALLKYLKEYHISVPQNASVISFGGHAVTRIMSPALTSLAFDYNRYAHFVCDTLFAMMEQTAIPTMPEIYHIQEGDSVR